MECPKSFTIIEDRIEQWQTNFTVKELGITGDGEYGLIQALAKEVWRLQNNMKPNNNFEISSIPKCTIPEERGDCHAYYNGGCMSSFQCKSIKN